MQDEIRSLLQFVLDLLRDYGLDDFYLELSTRNPEKSIGSDEDWERATDALREAAEASRAGAGARPGRRRVLRAEDQRAGQGRDRPHLADVDDPGRPHAARPVRARVHRRRRLPAAPGDDPPRAVRVDRAVLRRAHRALRRRVPGLARAGPGRSPSRSPDDQVELRRGRRGGAAQRTGVRVEVDAGDDRMQKKIRTHTLQKVPFLLLAGARDAEAGAVSFRFRDGTQRNGVPVDEAVAELVGWVRRRENTSPTADVPAPVARRRRPDRRVVDGAERAPRMRDLGRCGAPDGAEAWTSRCSSCATASARRTASAALDAAPARLHQSATSEAEQGCPFCRIPTLPDDDGLVVARGATVYAVLNLHPYNPGHLMVRALPARGGAGGPRRRRVGGADDRHPHRAAGAAGGRPRRTRSTSGLNLGAVAGGSLADHLHQHVVPRWGGDANFIAVIGQTKVIPQLLSETRALLADGLAGAARTRRTRRRARATGVTEPPVRARPAQR